MDVIILMVTWGLSLCMAGLTVWAIVLAAGFLGQAGDGEPGGRGQLLRGITAVVLVGLGALLIGTAVATAVLVTGGETGVPPLRQAIARWEAGTTHR